MAQCARAVNILNNDFGGYYSHHHTVVVGFAEGSREQGVSHGRESSHASMARARSLLSDLLLRPDAAVHFSCAVSDMDQEEEEETCSMDGSMDWEGSLDPWQGLTHPPEQERSRDSDGSSSVSQPIPIPAVCYFKDEMQRAALDKLNQKRKWYQQQLEAERMMSKSIAKSKQGAAASKGNKPTGRPGAPA